MKTNKKLLAAVAGVVACVIVVWCSTSIHGGEKTYEIQPQITIPEYRTDAARAIDAYERLMDRYMGLTEKNLTRIDINIRNAVRKLDSIDAKLTDLSTRMARIETALGIEQPKWQTWRKPQPKAVDKKPPKKPSLPPGE